VIVTFDEYVTLHVTPEVDVQPVHPLKLLFPAVAGALKTVVVPEAFVTVKLVVPVATTFVFGGP
jgi:hypothetical protein